MVEELKGFIIYIINKLKHAYEYIYNNYNYKQLLLILLVFFTVWLVEKINYLNAMTFGTIAPPIPMASVVSQSIPPKAKTKPNHTTIANGKKKSAKRK